MAERGTGELGNCFFPLASLDCLDLSQYEKGGVGDGGMNPTPVSRIICY